MLKAKILEAMHEAQAGLDAGGVTKFYTPVIETLRDLAAFVGEHITESAEDSPAGNDQKATVKETKKPAAGSK